MTCLFSTNSMFSKQTWRRWQWLLVAHTDDAAGVDERVRACPLRFVAEIRVLAVKLKKKQLRTQFMHTKKISKRKIRSRLTKR